MDLCFQYFFYTSNNMISFYTYPLFIKYFKVMSSFCLKLFGEKGFVYSVKVFPLNIKSINPMQKYPYVTESYACILKFCFNVFIFNKCFNFFRNMFYPKRIKISNIIFIHMQGSSMSSNMRILTKIYHICPIL